jgi:hypothetical protein
VYAETRTDRNMGDQLSDCDPRDVRELLEELEAGPKRVSPDTVKATDEGLPDIQAGRTISLDELERKYGL